MSASPHGEHAAAHRSAELPGRLEYQHGNGMFGGERITWEADRLVWLKYGHNGAGSSDTIEEARPPNEAWRDFWRRIDALGVWSWQASYPTPPSRSMPDGNVWRAVLEHAGRAVSSSSYNASPPTSAAFREALMALFAAARRSERPWEPDTLFLFESHPAGVYALEWMPSRIAVTYRNLEPRGAARPPHTDPPNPHPSLQPGTLVIRTSKGSSAPVEASRTPSRGAWEALWPLLARSGVSTLSGRAGTEGATWGLDLQHGADRVHVSGTGDPPLAFRQARSALEALTR